jgi:hypothetical protein
VFGWVLGFHSLGGHLGLGGGVRFFPFGFDLERGIPFPLDYPLTNTNGRTILVLEPHGEAKEETMTMKAEIKDGNLVITIEADLQATRRSSTGKTRIVATSGGNQATTVMVQGQPVVIGLNAYIRG